jgi:hypothetical protein
MQETKEKIDIQENELQDKANTKQYLDNYHRDQQELEDIIHKFVKRYYPIISGWAVIGTNNVFPMTNLAELDKINDPVNNESSFLEEKLI